MDQPGGDRHFFAEQHPGFDLGDPALRGPGPLAFPQASEGFLAVLFLVSGQIAFGTVLSPLSSFFKIHIPKLWATPEVAVQCAASLMVLTLLLLYIFLARNAGARAAGFASDRPGRDILSGLGYAVLAFGLGIIATLIFLLAAENILMALGWTRHAAQRYLEQSGARETRTAQQVMSVLGAVVAVGVAPVLEELVFRGMLFRGLRRYVSFWPAAAVSAALFTSLHFYIVGAPMIFVMAIVAAWTVERHGSLVPGIAMHAAWNMRVFLIVAWQALY